MISPVVEGEIRIGDRAYLQPDRIGEILEAGADIVVRAGWKNARWLRQNSTSIIVTNEIE